MNMTFDITRDDFSAQLSYIRKRLCHRAKMNTVSFFSNIVIYFFFGLGGLMLFDFYRRYQGRDVLALQLGFGAVLIGFVLSLLAPRLLQRRMNGVLLSESGTTLGQHDLSVTKERLIERTRFREIHTTWQGIQEIEHTTEYIGIFTDNAECLWIPTRAFPSEQGMKDFLVEITSYSKSAKGHG